MTTIERWRYQVHDGEVYVDGVAPHLAPAMNGAAAPAAYDRFVLGDGTVVEVHLMQPDDAGELVRFHATLSTETTFLRYFTIHPELSADEVARFTTVDHVDREALVAVVAGHLVAVARFDRLDDGDAEVAFVVADHLQGHGLGTALFARLAARAREVGIRRFVAETLPHNRRMLSVFRNAGLPCSTTFSDGVAHVVIDL
jgi:GNAT superfamily N-acetyltransferase